jgi:hypothetical protein
MLLTFLRLTSFLILYIGLRYGLHEGHTLIAPNFFVGLLGNRGLTCCCREGLTIAIIATAVQGVAGLVRAAVGFAMKANLLPVNFLGTQSLEPPDAFLLGLLLASGRAVSCPWKKPLLIWRISTKNMVS